MEAIVAYAHDTTPAFIVTVGPDHMIRLPDSVPLGSKVAVVIVGDAELDPMSASRATERKANFDAALAAVREAMARGYEGSHLPSDEEIARLVDEARKSRSS